MPFDPALFAELAVELPAIQKCDKEARIRTSFGRSYYAVFSALRVALRSAEGRHMDDRIPEHGDLPKALYLAADESGDDEEKKTLTALAKTLEELMDARRQADYVLDPPAKWVSQFSKVRTAELAAKKARDVVARIRSMDLAPVARKL